MQFAWPYDGNLYTSKATLPLLCSAVYLNPIPFTAMPKMGDTGCTLVEVQTNL